LKPPFRNTPKAASVVPPLEATRCTNVLKEVLGSRTAAAPANAWRRIYRACRVIKPPDASNVKVVLQQGVDGRTHRTHANNG